MGELISGLVTEVNECDFSSRGNDWGGVNDLRSVEVTIWGFLVGVLGLEKLGFVRYVAREGSRVLIYECFY